MIVIFENLEPVHLEKDVGALPLSLKKNEDWNITLYSSLKRFKRDEYEEEINLKFFTRFKNRKINNICLYWDVIKNSKRINYITAFHGGNKIYALFWLCKLINKNIVTHIKLDMSELNSNMETRKNSNPNFFIRIFRGLIRKSVNLFTVETKFVFEKINKISHYKNKLFYLPNGFYAPKPYDWITKKEKIIITVGRIGAPAKNNELLLSAISQLENTRDYKFYFIGQAEDSFKNRLTSLLEKKPELKDKIILTGNITDKKKLHVYYKRAEIFCFTSIYEGFSLALIEAAYFGCYIVSTDLSAAYDLTENGRHASILKINDKLNTELEENSTLDVVKYCDENFDEILKSKWFSESSKKLSDVLQKTIDKEVDTLASAKFVSKNTYENFNWIYLSKNFSTLLKDAASLLKSNTRPAVR